MLQVEQRPGQPVIERGPSLADRVVAEVRDRVRERRLVPGETYSVYRLADELGVSRSPVREGLLKLAEAGLVEFHRNRGFHVLLPTSREIAEIFAVRRALEVPAAARAATSAGDAAREALAACLATMDDLAAQPGDAPWAAFWAEDRRLHRLVLDAAGNHRTTLVVEGLRDTTSLLGAPTGRTRATICAEHRPVVDAVLAGDGPRAAAAMAEHLASTALLLMARADGVDADDPGLRATWDALTGV